jgi:hypothetical protein
MYGQREEVTAFARSFFSHHGAQHRGIFDSDEDSPGSLPCDTAGFQGDCLATILERFSYWIHDYSPILCIETGTPWPLSG